MPLFGFECLDCDEEFEELVMGAAGTDETTCPQCGSEKVVRKLSMVAAMPKSTQARGFCPTNPDCTTSG